MKKITLLFSLLAVSLGTAQSLPIDFDDALDANFTTAGGAVFTVTADGTNAVGQIIGGADQYNSRMDLVLDTYIDMTTTAKTFTFEFYTTEAIVMNGLLQISAEGAGGFAIEKGFVTDGNIGWETITIDFTDATNGYPNAGAAVVFGQYAQISVFTNFADTGVSTYWIDDISGAANGDSVPVTGPTSSPTTPIARDAGDVISIFSDAYTDVALGEVDPAWSTGVVSTIDVAGNNVWKITNCDYFAVTQYAGIDFSEMEMLHIDYWTGDTAGLLLNIKIVDTSTAVEELISLGNTVSGSWQSVEVDLSTLTMDASSITQILYDPTSEGMTHYVDNFYFYKAPTAGLEDFAANEVKMYPNPAKGFVNFSSASNVALDVAVYDMLGKQVLRAEAIQSQLNISSLNPGMYFVNMTQGSNVSTKKLLVN